MDKEELKTEASAASEYIPRSRVSRLLSCLAFFYFFFWSINEEATHFRIQRYQRIYKNVAKNVKACESADNRKKKMSDYLIMIAEKRAVILFNIRGS